MSEQPSIKELWARAIAKAWQDPEYKAKLEHDPTDEITKLAGGVELERILVVPDRPPDLTDEQLNALSQGLVPDIAIMCVCK